LRNILNEEKRISILGCGWYGLPLGKKLIELGYSVKGSTTDANKLAVLKDCKIQPFLIQLPNEKVESIDATFFDSEVLILNIPPKRRPDIVDCYFEQMRSVDAYIKNSNLKNIIFISSTSVYPDRQSSTEEHLEVFPEKDSGKALLKAEQLFLNQKQLKTIVLRFAGLIGADRNPGRFLADKRGLKDGNAPVNLVHLDDCIQITIELLNRKFESSIFNVCCDEHPLRKDYYCQAAIQLGLTPPTFASSGEVSSYKIINNTKIKEYLARYQFRPLSSV